MTSPGAVPPARERVVLAKRRGARMSLATRVAAAVGLLFAVAPVLLLVFPDVADVVVFGVRLPWLLAVSVPLPILLVAGWFYIRAAERNEQDFADLVDD